MTPEPTAINRLNALVDYISTTNVSSDEYQEILQRVNLISSLFVEDRMRLEKADKDFEAAFVAFGKFCEAVMPIQKSLTKVGKRYKPNL